LDTSRLPPATVAKENSSFNDEISNVTKQDEIKEEMNFAPSLQSLPIYYFY
jgi:hypothetical protein